jgi:asparagine synthase (glutamine-hydrolysing)
VLAWSQSAPGALTCYTFGGPYRDCADVIIARRLAELCRLPHTTIRVGENFFTRFTALAEQAVYLSDGTMDVSGAVEVHVNQEARSIAPVRLTGNYGSEILRSHVAFRPGRLDRSLFTPEFVQLIDAAAETYRAEAACHRLTFIAFKQMPWHHQSRFSLEKSQLTPRSPFLDNELVALAYRAPAELSTSPQPLLNLIARGNPKLGAVATDRALRRQSWPLVSRVAHSWQEFTAKAEYAYDYGMPPWLARADHAMTRLHLEKLFLGRHKFYHFRVWYRDQLRQAVRDQTADLGRGTASFCYRAGAAKRLVDEHLSGRVNRTLELHKLISLQMTDRLLLHAA